MIQRLTCDFALNKDTLEMAYAIDFDAYFADELQELKALAQAGLLMLDGRWISVTPRGRMLVRNVCMVFDRYLQADRDRARFSKII